MNTADTIIANVASFGAGLIMLDVTFWRVTGMGYIEWVTLKFQGALR